MCAKLQPRPGEYLDTSDWIRRVTGLKSGNFIREESLGKYWSSRLIDITPFKVHAVYEVNTEGSLKIPGAWFPLPEGYVLEVARVRGNLGEEARIITQAAKAADVLYEGKLVPSAVHHRFPRLRRSS